ncbi:hypothetical protein HDV06_006269 [Boothiomyces sp. JEL0866]|nr:hypothetical protein HDV06_006269 [Boothiomyces sp. JEL0866]
MSILVANAIPLAGGCFFSGLGLAATTYTMYNFGVEWNVLHDRKRQTIINLICFICCINGLVAYTVNQTGPVSVANVTTWISFCCVQFCIFMTFHNTAMRIASVNLFDVTKINHLCIALYFCPFVTLIPVYFASAEKIPQGEMLNTSTWNTVVYKPLNLSLILISEGLATLSEFYMLKNIKKLTPEKKKNQGEGLLSKNLKVHYALVWATLAFDVILKVLILYKYPLLFDSIVTIVTMAFRARCNLEYGLNLHRFFKKGGSRASECKQTVDNSQFSINVAKN